MCDDCDALVAHHAGPAHSQLMVTDARKRPGGLSQGVTFRYRCSTCGFIWLRAAASTHLEALWVGGHGPVAATAAGSLQEGAQP
jgi:hypothetical protein